MKNLLYLVHRLPYPPNKGDKITSYNMLRYLSTRFNVFLGCFVDTPHDWQYLPRVQEFCADLCAVGLHPAAAKALSLRGLVTGKPLSLPYYRNRRLQRWVDGVLQRQRIDSVLILSGAMAQYIPDDLDPGIRTVLDLEDVDSDKWHLFARDHAWPLNRILQRESRKLFEYEQAMARSFDVTLFVSREEARMFQAMAPEVAHKVRYRVQGVDSRYFDPAIALPNPYGDRRNVLVFTGAMDYWPNTDAVTWFAREVMPLIRRSVPDALFCIVGMNPVPKVRALAEDPSVMVTGGVPDVRPYLAHAAAAALPLRVARGIQNKILEAMAMEKPVLATPEAIHGIEPCPGFSPAIASTATELAEKAVALLEHRAGEPSQARSCIVRRYDWDRNLQIIHELLAGDPGEAAEEPPQGEAPDAHTPRR